MQKNITNNSNEKSNILQVAGGFKPKIFGTGWEGKWKRTAKRNIILIGSQKS